MVYRHPSKESDDMEAMMNIQTPALSTDPQLDQPAGQFEHWRQHRSHPSERIPQALWDQAAALATVIPYSRVAKQLRRSPSDLKKQMLTPQHLTCRTPVPTLSVIEVPAVSQPPAAHLETEIELERADGLGAFEAMKRQPQVIAPYRQHRSCPRTVLLR
jgi:hypothetical protein